MKTKAFFFFIVNLLVLTVIVNNCKAQGFSSTKYDSIVKSGNTFYKCNWSPLGIRYVNGYAIITTDANHYCHMNTKRGKIYLQTYPVVYDFNDKGKAVVVTDFNVPEDLALYTVIDTKGQELMSEWGRNNSLSDKGCLFPLIIEEYMK
jgi:hypothetical protein